MDHNDPLFLTAYSSQTAQVPSLKEPTEPLQSVSDEEGKISEKAVPVQEESGEVLYHPVTQIIPAQFKSPRESPVIPSQG
jgi:hypothetical protein